MRDELDKQTIWARMRRKLMRGRRSAADAEDALHSAYLRLRNLPTEPKIDNVEAFLVRVANNIAIDGERRRAFQADRPIEEIFADSADPGPLQDEVIEARIRLRHVEAALAQLSPRTREIFLMHRLDGYKYREIAERLEISQSTVEKHIAKAVLFLAQWAREP